VLFLEEAPTAGFVKPTFGKLQFRHGSSARYDSDFAKDQPWVKIRGKSKSHASLVLISKTLLCRNAGTLLTEYGLVCSEFVDEIPELDEIYLSNPKTKVAPTPDTATPPQSRHAASVTSPTGSAAVASIGSDEPTFETSWTPRSLQSPTQITSPFKRRRTNDSDRVSFASIGQPSPTLPGEKMQLTPYFELPISLNRDLTNRPCSSLHPKSSDLHLQLHLVPG